MTNSGDCSRAVFGMQTGFPPHFEASFAVVQGYLYGGDGRKMPQKQSGTPRKTFFRPVFSEKPQTSLPQTSVLLRQNLGTLPHRSPMFPFFRRKTQQKCPFRILRYFGTTRMPMAFEALLSPLSAPCKMLISLKIHVGHSLHTARSDSLEGA